MNAAVGPIDGGKATLAELRRAGIEALAKALGPVGMARFLQQFDPGQGDYTAERGRILGNPSVDLAITHNYFAMLKPISTSVRRANPRHITVLPGGGS